MSTAVVTRSGASPSTLSPAVEPRWYAIQTRCNWEKRISDQLKLRGIENFLPTYKETRRWSDRSKPIELPAFPGYAFVRTSLSEKLQVLQTAGVFSFVSFNGYAPPIPDKQIQDLQRLADNNLLCSSSSALTVGRRVRIKGGSLDGLECVLVSRRGEDNLEFTVEPIQRSIRILVSDYQLEAL
jgi:transcription antitermination factor NusG